MFRSDRWSARRQDLLKIYIKPYLQYKFLSWDEDWTNNKMIIISWAYLARRRRCCLSKSVVFLGSQVHDDFILCQFQRLNTLQCETREKKKVVVENIMWKKNFISYWRSIIYDNFLLTRTTKHISTSASRPDELATREFNFSPFFYLSLSLPSHTHLAHSLLDSSINSARWRSVIISSTNMSRKFFRWKKQIFNEREKKTFNEVQRSTRHAWTSNDTMTERFLWLFPASLEQPFVGGSRENK